ncbi:MAG: hypothetical protein JO345_32430 [Streptosporangiaceae bacterium]|nr:hypothetical protein [Streptosporangiaceae bacterium]
MTADYEKIREENIARYGWDTAVLDLLGKLYSERTHFIFELIQNAEDAGATDLAFELFDDRLEVWHDGRPFTEADVRGVCGVGQTEKAGDLTKIGKFGIGFKSVYAYTRSPRVHSGGESFRIENYVRPHSVEPRDDLDERDTLFVFPFDHDGVPPATAAREISAALGAIAPATLLFLRNIERLRVAGAGVASAVISRSVDNGPGTSRRVGLTKGRATERWLVWRRPVDAFPGYQVELAFRLHQDQIAGCASSPLTVFLPTQKETFLGFVVQGPYRTTPARDNIGEHDPANQILVRETAALLIDVLAELRAGDRLTPDVMTAMPLDPGRFPRGSVFRPLFDAVRDAFAREDLIPVADGGYRRAGEVRLPAAPGLEGLLGAGDPFFFVAENISAELWRYLRDEIGIGEVTAADVVATVTAEFLHAKTDDWIARFYAFVYSDPALWRAPRLPGESPGIARTRPIIRLEDGSQVAPFDPADQPAVYLPRPGGRGTGFPTVRRAIADSPVAQPFLTALDLATPDVTDEAVQLVLPKYEQLNAASIDAAQHDADLDLVLRALDEAPAGKRHDLLERLRRTAFLIGENAATGEQRLMPPPELYQRGKDLEIYFDGNPDAWFAGDRYGPWRVQLREMGVRDAVEVRARRPGPLGHVILADQFARHERGIDGFDPDAGIAGLDFALRHPSHARSEFVWNILLAPNRRLLTGVVERSVRDEFVDSTRETVSSAIAAAAGLEAWLPGPDGVFHRPSELSLDDLPPTYSRDETLARALDMAQPVIAEAARQLGVAPRVLWGLRANPDLVAMIERELGRRSESGA